MHNFATRLHLAIQAKATPVLVGLDPRPDLLPDELRSSPGDHDQTAAAMAEFCCRIIDMVAPLVPAVKPQAAFFEQCGPAGGYALQRVIRYARDQGLLVICDAKRGDIGSTAEAYADAYLAGETDEAPWGADALTVNPYLGADTLEPFVRVAVQRGAGIYVLVRTSNPGAGLFQDVQADGQTLYQRVAKSVEGLAAAHCGDAAYGPVGAVVGATWPEQLGELRAAMPHVPLLVPGYGSQGGTAQDVAGAFAPDGLGALVNNSRGLIFAWTRDPYRDDYGPKRWLEAVEAATRNMIEDLAAATPAGSLRTC